MLRDQPGAIARANRPTRQCQPGACGSEHIRARITGTDAHRQESESGQCSSAYYLQVLRNGFAGSNLGVSWPRASTASYPTASGRSAPQTDGVVLQSASLSAPGDPCRGSAESAPG